MAVSLMVRIGKMGVVMDHWFMAMPMGMPSTRGNRRIVHVLMVRIVDVFVAMFHRLVDVGVFMPFGQMQPDTERHQGAGSKERQSNWLPTQYGKDSPKKRGDGEIRASPGDPQMTHADDEKNEADAVSQQPHHQGC